MAVQFPNFLGVPVRTPDYSGIGDVFENYYKGKAMPKDDLIKAIQAQFARPAAEASLRSAQLSNRAGQLNIQKLSQELSEKAAFDKYLNQALNSNPSTVNSGLYSAPSQMNQSSGMSQPVQSGGSVNMPPSAAIANAMVNNGYNQPEAPRFDPTKMSMMPNGINQGAQGMPIPQGMPAPMPSQTAQQAAMAGASMQAQPDPQPQFNEIVLKKGLPHLAGIDQMWDAKPEYRKYLEARGYKKTEQVKVDNKTGKTTILTTYPSGTITMQTMSKPASEDGVPLTNAMVTKHQQVSAAVDNLIPILEKLKNLPEHSNVYLGNWQATGTQKKYERLVSAAKENILRAFSLNPTDSGLQTALDQLTIGGAEDEKDYREAMLDLINDMLERKAYSDKQLKKSNKISPVDTSANGSSASDGYSSNEWEPT
jgi:hypothetical protein